MRCDSCGRPAASADSMLSSMTELMTTQNQLLGGIVALLAQGTGQMVRGVLGQATAKKTPSCCDIPDPCWMPVEIGDVECRLCEGGKGMVRLRVTNTDFRPRGYEVVAAGADAGRVSIDTASFTLGPKERRTVTATFESDGGDGGRCPEPAEALVWVLGCRNHYLRWTIRPGRRHEACCFDVEVPDGPDYVLHWYDHFYCPRQCFGPATRPNTQRPEG